MKNSVSSSVPNMRTMPRLSTNPVQGQEKTLPQNTTTPPATRPSHSSIAPTHSGIGLTGLESTEGNFASSYIPPSEEILAEYAFSEEIYKKNKKKYQRMLIAPQIQHLMIDNENENGDAEILLKP